ncbi:MAG TPA: metalloregulator ArsR/SmtB family transcription factor, partial [Turneriella sp.]|nr:metalloregulator ArsR/SmtB family transcription factor [Turneriella sp.]
MPGALQLLKALSEPVRIRLYLLLRQSSLTVSELSEILALSQSNTSHHVKALRELDLLTAEKTGQHTYYALNRSTLADS